MEQAAGAGGPGNRNPHPHLCSAGSAAAPFQAGVGRAPGSAQRRGHWLALRSSELTPTPHGRWGGGRGGPGSRSCLSSSGRRGAGPAGAQPPGTKRGPACRMPVSLCWALQSGAATGAGPGRARRAEASAPRGAPRAPGLQGLCREVLRRWLDASSGPRALAGKSHRARGLRGVRRAGGRGRSGQAAGDARPSAPGAQPPPCPPPSQV